MPRQQKLIIGIIAAPERATDITINIKQNLSTLLSKHINSKIDWHIEHLVDPLTGAAEAAQDILYNASNIKEYNKWDYALCLTDLPIFYQKDIVAADINFQLQVAQISMPAFGWIRVQKRIKRALIQLIAELYENETREDPKHYNSNTVEQLHEETTTYILKRYFPIMPIRRQENPDIIFKSDFVFVNNEDHNVNMKHHEEKEHPKSYKKNPSEQTNERNDNNIDVRFLVYPKLLGQLKLLSGMTFANNPLKIMSSFKSVIAIAFTTGAFALIFPTIWNLSQIFSMYRLTGMMLAAILSLVAWIIVAHNLWEFPSKRNRLNIRRLYNLATISTLLIDVITYYIFLFILFLFACLIFIPIDYFQSMTTDYDHIGSVLMNFMRVAWAAASISTIVSAIGAGLENEELVREITYGYRQQRRSAEINHYKKG